MTRPIKQVDETAVKRRLLTALFMAGAVFLPFMAIRLNNPMLIGLIFVLPFGVWLIGNPASLFLTLFLVAAAKLRVPGIPGGLTLIVLLKMAVIGWSFVYAALTKNKVRLDVPAKFLVFFMVNMVLIMSVRGFGFRLLGSTDYGGAEYIYLAIGMLLYIASSRISLREKHVRILFWGGLFLSLIPFLVQLSLFVTAGKSYYLTNFIDVSVGTVATALIQQTEAGDFRWSETAGLVRGLLLFALVIPAIRRRKILSWGLVGLALVITLASGFRGRLVGLGILIFCWLIYDSKNRKQTFFFLTISGLLAWVIILTILPSLPDTYQRTFSVLPLAELRISDPHILQEAQHSVDFRLDIWREAWANVPRYFLVGRGMTFDITGWAWLQKSAYGSTQFFYASHAYHSGFFELLVDFGLAGLLLVIGFMWRVCADAWRGVRLYCAGRNDLISRYYAFLTILFTYTSIAFFVIYGDVKDILIRMIMTAALLRVIRNELKSRDENNSLPPVVAGDIK